MSNLTGKNAITPTIVITGASSGIGRASALYFHQRGWNVVATMRNPDREQSSERLRYLKLDVNNQESIDQALATTIGEFGTIDVIVNNAGFGTVGAFECSTDEQVFQQFDTNVFGLMRMTRGILPHFRERRRGLIINVSSIGGRVTFPLYSVYHSTKWAVEGFTESLQYELAPLGIAVKLVEPGAIKTDFYSRSQMTFTKEGLNAYDNYQTKVMQNIAKAEANAPLPEIVAQTIYEAATDRGNRLRYSVGDQAPLFLFLKRVLPHSWFSTIVRSVLEKK